MASERGRGGGAALLLPEHDRRVKPPRARPRQVGPSSPPLATAAAHPQSKGVQRQALKRLQQLVRNAGRRRCRRALAAGRRAPPRGGGMVVVAKEGANLPAAASAKRDTHVWARPQPGVARGQSGSSCCLQAHARRHVLQYVPNRHVLRAPTPPRLVTPKRTSTWNMRLLCPSDAGGSDSVRAAAMAASCPQSLQLAKRSAAAKHNKDHHPPKRPLAAPAAAAPPCVCGATEASERSLSNKRARWAETKQHGPSGVCCVLCVDASPHVRASPLYSIAEAPRPARVACSGEAALDCLFWMCAASRPISVRHCSARAQL